MIISVYEIIEVAAYTKAIKKQAKKYRHIDEDIDNFLENVLSEDDLGISLGDDVYKVRIANSDKQKGKSSGYRLITYLKFVDNELYLLYIYDKSDLASLSEHEIDRLIKEQIDVY